MTEKSKHQPKGYNEASDRDEEDSDYTYDQDAFLYDPEEINIITREPTIEQLLRRINEKVLDLAPDFQRHADIWKDDVKSRLIESIVIRIPLPAFYIDATNEEKWLVVDGIQRLSALKQFVSDKTLKLSGLEYLKEFDGKTYDELEDKYKRRILETQITTYLIEKGTPFEVKYNIFKRINTGGEPLSPQELRHALNPGKATKFLTKLASAEEFERVIQLSKLRKMRMEDREFVLGFLAYTITSYTFYKDYNNRNKFLTKAMHKINDMADEDLEIIEFKFKRAMIAAFEIFGEDAFRKMSKNTTRKYPINQALFESWSVNLSKLEEAQIQKLIDRKEKIKDTFKECADNDKVFLKSISQASEKVQYRFSTIEKLIQEVL